MGVCELTHVIFLTRRALGPAGSSCCSDGRVTQERVREGQGGQPGSRGLAHQGLRAACASAAPRLESRAGPSIRPSEGRCPCALGSGSFGAAVRMWPRITEQILLAGVWDFLGCREKGTVPPSKESQPTGKAGMCAEMCTGSRRSQDKGIAPNWGEQGQVQRGADGAWRMPKVA